MSDQASVPDPRTDPRTEPHAGLAQRLVRRMRAKVAEGVTHLTVGSGPTLDYSSPPGDLGLFGPDTVCWKVHGDSRR